MRIRRYRGLVRVRRRPHARQRRRDATVDVLGPIGFQRRVRVSRGMGGRELRRRVSRRRRRRRRGLRRSRFV